MKTKKILSAIVLSGLLAFPAVSLAAEPVVASCSANLTQSDCNKAGCNWDPINNTCSGVLIEKASDLVDLINKIGNWVFVFLLAVAGILLIVAGFMWITAAGNPESINKARLMLINSFVGVVIALLAKGIVQVIRSILGA